MQAAKQAGVWLSNSCDNQPAETLGDQRRARHHHHSSHSLCALLLLSVPRCLAQGGAGRYWRYELATVIEGWLAGRRNHTLRSVARQLARAWCACLLSHMRTNTTAALVNNI